MAEIARSVLFGRLNALAFKALESAHAYCRLRENPYVEPAHWLHQILQGPDTDIHKILEASEIEKGLVLSEIDKALDTLPRGSTAVVDFSPHLEQIVERAFVFGALLYGANNVRTGHILIGMLKEPALAGVLRAVSSTLANIDPKQLTDNFPEITKLSSENEISETTAPQNTASVSTGSSAGAPGNDPLGKYCTDLVAVAAQTSERIVGRDDEIRQLIDILMRRRQNNPILTGEAGVGKTAVVEGLAGRLADDDIPEVLIGTQLMSLDIGALSAGASMKGEFEKRLKSVIDAVSNSPRSIILFIDEAHTLIGAGGAQGTGDAANLLKPALARGELRTIAATTWSEYKKYIESDPALTRRFQVVKVDEPDDAKAIAMMRSVAPMLEAHHNVRILDEAIAASVVFSRRYIADRQLPDKSVSLLDTVCARVALSQTSTPALVEISQRRISSLKQEVALLEREALLTKPQTKRIKTLKKELKTEEATQVEISARWDVERDLFEKIKSAETVLIEKDISKEKRAEHKRALKSAQSKLEKLQGEAPLILPRVDELAVSQVVADWTGVPVNSMVADEMRTLLELETTLSKRVVGQDTGLAVLSKRIRTNRAGLGDPEKPVGVLILCGPSGVGKTETALALTELLYGGTHNLITLNMSEFQERHTVSTLKGAPPGYVGYGEGGKLTEAVRRKPYSVVLLDEVEKAHPDVHEVFFQVFDKGMMEDGEGRRIDFKNTLILLTSNVGSQELTKLFDQTEGVPTLEAAREVLRGPLLDVFPAALLGRMVVTPYYPLTDDILRTLISMRLDKIVARAKQVYDVDTKYDRAVVDLILSRCHERESGGRVVDSILTNTVLPKISETFLTAKLDGTRLAHLKLMVEKGEILYEFQP